MQIGTETVKLTSNKYRIIMVHYEIIMSFGG
jgi:hypothetical protein